ncbi:MAG: ThiF family adenylyltransferase [Candidatus Desantisbacteria bacterium]
MKILLVGVGGIGSWLIEELCKSIEQEQIDANTEISIADNDMVEIAQVKYQNFTFDEAGLNKAEALANRFKMFGVTAIKDRIKNVKQLKGHDFIILCVDNEPSRELIITYCFKKGIEFLDLRASGRVISAFPKQDKLSDNLKFVDGEDNASYSCQDRNTLNQGRIDKGNKIIALIGVQMVLNHIRGMRNKVMSISI